MSDESTSSGPSDPRWAMLDLQVQMAWTSRRLSDGTRLHLGGTDKEQGFVVTTTGTRAIAARRAGWSRCADHTERRSTILNLQSILPNAGGHTHPLGSTGDIIAGIPGQEDGQMAAATQKPAYVISMDRAFAIEVGNPYLVRLVSGRNFSSSERKIIAERVEIWAQHGGGSGVVCRFTPD